MSSLKNNQLIMKKFEAKNFSIQTLKGISDKTTEEHMKLYEGYVKNANLILEQIEELSQDVAKNTYTIGELQRRFSFEFDGMRNHEYYFGSLENGPVALTEESALKNKITEDFGSFDKWLENFKLVAKTRGIGWATLSYDEKENRLLNSWADEQHLGHLTGLKPILMLDMWEHSFVADYQPSGKATYIEDFFANLNWGVIEGNFGKSI